MPLKAYHEIYCFTLIFLWNFYKGIFYKKSPWNVRKTKNLCNLDKGEKN